MKATSCGVLVRDAAGRVLLGQASLVKGRGLARWDIPKGVAEAGEAFVDAAVRELGEETGLVADPAALRIFGVHRYLPAKDLALFGWDPGEIDVAGLRCRSTFVGRDGREVPELARFALVEWDEMLGRVGKNMARVLGTIGSGRDV